MYYKIHTKTGDKIFSDILSKDYYSKVPFVPFVFDGLSDDPNKISFAELGNKNLIFLGKFRKYDSSSDTVHNDLFSVAETIKKIIKGNDIYVAGNYFSNNLVDLGHHYMSNGNHHYDPFFEQKDAKVVEAIIDGESLKLVLECKKWKDIESYVDIPDDAPTEKHEFTVVQVHY